MLRRIIILAAFFFIQNLLFGQERKQILATYLLINSNANETYTVKTRIDQYKSLSEFFKISYNSDTIIAESEENLKIFIKNKETTTSKYYVSKDSIVFLENIFVNAKVHELLVYSLEHVVEEKDAVFSCKFLADERGTESIYQAREFLLQHIGDPITIKELSRKVAMNECYLKKGFKEVFGTTIFDFYQQQRMEHAKYLLYEKALSVTDVSALLGYSSISHFSAAFKKHTGLKPCELLN